MERYRTVFAIDPLSPNVYDGPPFTLPMEEGAIPVKQRSRPFIPPMKAEIKKHIDLMLEHKVIEPSVFPWASPVVLARKKNSDWRFCVDLRIVNSLTKKDTYHLPRIDETLDTLGTKSLINSGEMICVFLG